MNRTILLSLAIVCSLSLHARTFIYYNNADTLKTDTLKTDTIKAGKLPNDTTANDTLKTGRKSKAKGR